MMIAILKAILRKKKKKKNNNNKQTTFNTIIFEKECRNDLFIDHNGTLESVSPILLVKTINQLGSSPYFFLYNLSKFDILGMLL